MPAIRTEDSIFPCRGILFDKDGTLLDFMALWSDWALTLTRLVEGQLTVMGAAATVPAENLLGLMLDTDGQMKGYDKTGPLAMGTEEEVTAILAWQLYVAGVPWNEALLQIRSFNTVAMQKLEEKRNAVPIRGLHGFLTRCEAAGIRLGVVTSDTTEGAVKHMDWLGIRKYFGSIVGRDRVINGKPDPEMAELAMGELGIKAEDCLMIGDSNADMMMGRLAGLYGTIGIASEPDAAHYLVDADWIIPDYTVLEPIANADSITLKEDKQRE